MVFHGRNQQQRSKDEGFMHMFRIAFLVTLLLCPSLGSGETVVGFLIPVSGLGDQSFNDMTYAGLVKAKNELQFTLIREQCPDATVASRKTAMERLLARGARIIVVNGWEFHDQVKEYAPLHQDRYFIINDFPMSGPDNVASTVFGQHEGSFLAGTLAGMMTTTGQVAFVGGMDMPVIRAFLIGFSEGVNHVGRDVRIHEKFLGTGKDAVSGFNDPGLGYDTACTLFDQGIDVIFSVAGLSGNGIIRAAGDRKRYVIGVDADQDHMAKGYVLTSVMKRLDMATLLLMREVMNGPYNSGVHIFNLKNGGVDLSPMTYTRRLIPPEILQRLARVRQDIIEGKIVVTDHLQKSAGGR